ncbi:Endoplasmic reticulum metallopeptidase 1 [Frankliniella fusca]|uniref:FXNA-like protease n=1 Tax=Frankliniella fusca TaxID=407009 RepID=A0AAE1LMI2_9NEOP|nr:Endoplasmic reticulum metallopeptidase 1 [Frankliniella fusca]
MMHFNRSKGPLRFRGHEEDPKHNDNLINLEQQPLKTKKYRTFSSKMKIFSPPDSFFAPNWAPGIWVFLITLYLGLLAWIVGLIQSSLPTPLTMEDQSVTDYSESFIGKNAQAYLNSLIKMGPRPVGSEENEIMAPDFLRREISKIKKESNNIQRIIVSDQVVSGSFYINQKPVGYSSYYHNIQNIVVRLSSRNGNSSSAVLVNCHYDTVPGSPGASDDAFHCAVMLELLRILSHSQRPFMHDIIFLFNGAEESGLQASHGFITKHQWAKDVKTFINLEACGAGGKEALFQTGPNCPWLVETYAKTVPHPHGTVMGEELFQSGVIPSDTDFRIFRDFGHIPGMDFANSDNGFVYHTKFDNGKVVFGGSYQHTGENLLALVPAIANSPLLDSVKISEGSMVYFDFLGMFFVQYSKKTGTILNSFFALLSFFTILIQVFKTKKAVGLTSSEVSCIFCGSVASIVIGWVLSFLYILLLTMVLNWANCTQSWYRSFSYHFGLYYCTTMFFCVASPFILSKNSKLSNLHRSIMSSLSTQFIWTIVLLLGTIFGIRSTYLILIFVIPSTLSNLGLMLCRDYKSRTWIVLQLLQSLIPLLMGIGHTITAMTVFIPITNRSGAALNVELAIGILSAATCILTISYLVPLSMFVRHISVLSVFAAAHLIVVVTVLGTRPLPFYEWQSGESGVLQRVPLWHVQREVFGESGETRLSDSGYWVMGMDRSASYLLKESVPEISFAEKATIFCGNELFCALPLYSPRITNFLNGSNWIPGPKPFKESILSIETQISTPTSKIRRIGFVISGPQQMSFMFSPLPGISVQKWSLEADLVSSALLKGRPAYFVFYQRGLDTTDSKSWTFHVDFKIDDNLAVNSNHTVTLGVSGSHINPDYFSEEFKLFIQKFPKWSFVSPRASELKIWEM